VIATVGYGLTAQAVGGVNAWVDGVDGENVPDLRLAVGFAFWRCQG
jgi:hypothetical protein